MSFWTISPLRSLVRKTPCKTSIPVNRAYGEELCSIQCVPQVTDTQVLQAWIIRETLSKNLQVLQIFKILNRLSVHVVQHMYISASSQYIFAVSIFGNLCVQIKIIASQVKFFFYRTYLHPLDGSDVWSVTRRPFLFFLTTIKFF